MTLVKYLITSASALVVLSCSFNSLAIHFEDSRLTLLNEVIASEIRKDKDKIRDKYRKPFEVLEFFDVDNNETVLEIWPGNGWYSDILAPYLKSEGQLIAATFATNNLNSDDKRLAFWSKISIEYVNRYSDQEKFGEIEFIEFEPPAELQLVESGSVDTALIVRSLHVWDEMGQLKSGLRSVFKALKPGGVLGIIQHRASPFSDISSSAPEGYLAENYVIEAAQAAGFKFVEKSEILANEKDTKDYPKGVYALPPMLAMGAMDRDKYLEIGESDRMTLKFVKPI